jgi:hypothetical protein
MPHVLQPGRKSAQQIQFRSWTSWAISWEGTAGLVISIVAARKLSDMMAGLFSGEGVGCKAEVRQVMGTGRFSGLRYGGGPYPSGVAGLGGLKSRSRPVAPVVQSRSSLVQCSNWARSPPVQTSGARGLGIRCGTSIPAGRSREAHGTRLLQPDEGIRRSTGTAGADTAVFPAAPALGASAVL